MSKPLKRNVLGTKDINIIIDIWRDNIGKLRGVHRNVHVYSNMCTEAEKHGIILSPTEMRTRINNLTKKYRAEKSKQGKSGGSPSEWAYNSVVHSILGQFKSINFREQMDESAVFPEDWLDDSLEVGIIEEIDEPGTSEAGSQSSASVDTSLSPAFGATPSTSASGSRKRKLNSTNSNVLEIMEKDQKLMEHFLNKTLENDQKTIELLQENNKLLSEFLKK